jgi:hypothetical protein
LGASHSFGSRSTQVCINSNTFPPSFKKARKYRAANLQPAQFALRTDVPAGHIEGLEEARFGVEVETEIGADSIFFHESGLRRNLGVKPKRLTPATAHSISPRYTPQCPAVSQFEFPRTLESNPTCMRNSGTRSGR